VSVETPPEVAKKRFASDLVQANQANLLAKAE
jgi:hypothetical protein